MHLKSSVVYSFVPARLWRVFRHFREIRVIFVMSTVNGRRPANFGHFPWRSVENVSASEMSPISCVKRCWPNYHRIRLIFQNVAKILLFLLASMTYIYQSLYLFPTVQHQFLLLLRHPLSLVYIVTSLRIDK